MSREETTTHNASTGRSGEEHSPSETTAEAGSSEVDLKAQLEKLSDEKRDLNDRLLRLAAEFENHKRRARKEQEDAAARGLENLVRELLPAMDNFDRALSASKNPSTTSASILEGVQMVQRSFFSALEKSQIKPFDAEGKPFDPNFHEAIGQIEHPSLPPGHVGIVFQRGYMIGNRLLRPALVLVTRKTETADNPQKPEVPTQAN